MAFFGTRPGQMDQKRRVLDRRVRWRSRLVLILLAPLAFLLQWAAPRVPAVADFYGDTVFPLLQRSLATLTGWVPFSVAEVIAVAIVLWLVWSVWRGIRHLRRKQRRLRNQLLHAVVNLLATGSLVYAGAVLMWGMAFTAPPLDERLGWDRSPPSIEELRELCTSLVGQANEARKLVAEDENGVMRVHDSARQALGRAGLGFEPAGRVLPSLAEGFATTPKGLTLFSTGMSYLGLGGIFMFHTGEPSVNMKQPDATLSFTACHEMSHQMGFPREDEANFVGYLACSHHPDADFRYAGILAASRHAMRALYRADRESYTALAGMYDPAVRRDIAAIREFWDRYRSKATRVATRVNDLYLKSQGAEAGVRSYGLVVDLLVAERRAAVSAE
jgi:hypothetical protein